MNACLVKDPQRKDIISEYTSYYHEKICRELQNYWDHHHDNIGSN